MSIFFWMAKESADALREWLLLKDTATWTNVTIVVPEPRKRRKGKRK